MEQGCGVGFKARSACENSHCWSERETVRERERGMWSWHTHTVPVVITNLPQTPYITENGHRPVQNLIPCENKQGTGVHTQTILSIGWNWNGFAWGDFLGKACWDCITTQLLRKLAWWLPTCWTLDRNQANIIARLVWVLPQFSADGVLQLEVTRVHGFCLHPISDMLHSIRYSFSVKKKKVHRKGLEMCFIHSVYTFFFCSDKDNIRTVTYFFL